MATLPNDNDKEDKEFLRVQYQKLREEIVARNNAILQLENFTLAAFGTILTLGYSKIIPGIKSGNLMLFYNIIASISFLIYISNKTVIYTIGDFIVKTESLFSANSELLWEKSIRKGKLNKYRIFNSFAVAGFFAGTQVLALIATYLYGQSLEKKELEKVTILCIQFFGVNQWMLYAAMASVVATFIWMVVEEWWKDWIKKSENKENKENIGQTQK